MPLNGTTLSILICTRNRAQSLGSTLASLLRLENCDESELVIVDNGSEDDTPAVAGKFAQDAPFAVTLVHERRRGLGVARNTAIDAAGGDLLWFTDDDCYPAPDALNAIRSAFSDSPTVGLVGGRLVLHDPDDAPVAVRDSELPGCIPPGEFVDAGYVPGANMAVPRRIALDIGGFDPELGAGTEFSCEDADFAFRVCMAGWQVRYEPRIVVRHHHRRRGAEVVAKLGREYDIGRGAFYGKHLLDPAHRRTVLKSLWWLGWHRRAIGSPIAAAREILGAVRYWRRG